MIKKIVLFTSVLFINPIIQGVGFFPINLFWPWDINLRPPEWCGKKFQWTTWAEIGYKTQNGDHVTQIWSHEQDALAMLKGFGPGPITDFLNKVLGNPEDNGVRGNFIVHGDFRAREFTLAFRYNAPFNVTLSAHMPFYSMELRDVNFIDQTPDTTAQDIIVKDELTSVLAERVHQFDPSLNLNGWKKAGPGDLVLLGEWRQLFPQGKKYLKEVILDGRFALDLPTGVFQDLNEILSFPFGFDGSVGFIFGGGIDLGWFNLLRGGVDLEFIDIWGRTRNRRIKIDPEQTDFLLLAKAPAYISYGFTYRVNLYLQAHRFWKGLSTSLTYQYWKHGSDHLSLKTNEYSNEIANTAGSLQDWTINHIIYRLYYDFQCDWQAKGKQKSTFNPQIAFFYKYPLTGTRSILLNTAGLIFTLNF